MLATKSTLRCDTPRRWNLTRAALIAALFGAIPAAAAESECALGAYRLSDGGVIDVAAASEGALRWRGLDGARRSEEHTSELQSLMRISYAVFCLKKKKNYYYSK